MKKNVSLNAILFAVLAAVFYALNVPISKLLLNKIAPTFLASFLYLGAGLGVGIIYLFKQKNEPSSQKLSKKDLPYTILMVVLDILAPIFLMMGLKTEMAESASLLGNFEIVATAIIALLIFKEKINGSLLLGIGFITCGSAILSITRFGSLTFTSGSVFILLATLCWGFENNCTKMISDKSTYEIVTIKGLFSGLGSFIVAFLQRESFPEIKYIFAAMLLGFVAYGLSIFFYVRAQSRIGAAKTAAFYAIAPFISSLLGYFIFKSELTMTFYIGLALMLIGTVFVIERPKLFLPVYLFSLFLITVLRPWHGKFDFLYGKINLKLFSSYVTLYGTSKYIFYFLLIGNIVCLIPFGYYLKKYKKLKLWIIALLGLGLSLTIETLQFFTAEGIAELDDLILNVSGCVLGSIIALLI